MYLIFDDMVMNTNKFIEIKLDETGYVYDSASWSWHLPSWHKVDESSNEAPEPGIVVKFDYDKTKSKKDINTLLENRDKSIRIACEDADIFETSKQYMMYRMFCELMNSRCHLLRTDSIQPALFFSVKDDIDNGANKYLMLKNIALNIEWFADTIEDFIATLHQYLKFNSDMSGYEKLLKEMDRKLKYIYNERILPYASVKVEIFEWNLFEFITPHDQFVGHWSEQTGLPNCDIKMKDECEKQFGAFSHDEHLKKIYFDLYDMWFDDIVEHQWGYHVWKGWKPLVRELCEFFKEKEKNSYFWWERIQIVQLKEKFSQIRIYYDIPSDWYFKDVIEGKDNGLDDEEIDQFIAQLEDESLRTCEFCGITIDKDPTVESKSTYEHGWIKTLCSTCREKLEKDNSI